jgi:hypothetical protein
MRALALIFTLAGTLSYAPKGFAEYRAFELVISDAVSGKETVVLSTLDPNQYRKYYPTKNTDKITYRATWRCRGNTSGYKSVCPPPDKSGKRN